MTPLERAVALLKAHGYREASQPLLIASANFSFDAVLTADRTLELIVLIDTTLGKEDRLRSQIQAFSRALDVIGSRRTLTAVLVGQRLSAETLETFARFCRVLPVGTLTGEHSDQILRDWLAALLPLTLPDADEIQGDWRAEVVKRQVQADRRALAIYLNASESGSAAVQEELRRQVQSVLERHALEIGA